MIKKQEGITLIELIIAISLLPIIIYIGYSIYILGIRGFTKGIANLENQSNIRIAMGHITRNIRSTNNASVNGSSELKVGYDTYRLVGDVLRVNYNQLAVGVLEFEVSKPNSDMVSITITSIPDENNKSITLCARIYLRGS